MSFWKRLLQLLRWQPSSNHLFELDEGLVHSVQTLAEHQQRPLDEMASALLATGLDHYHTNNELWNYWHFLSPREQEVAAFTCLGYTNRQIAARLCVSIETVKTHMRNILFKFHLHGKAELRLALAEWDFSEWENPQR
jgi:DNA-binding CsgD family transcriptional regulator